MNRIESTEELRSLYGLPSFRAANKVFDSLDKHTRHFIEKSPFLLLASISKSSKVDNSPRGGNPGFVHIINDRQIAIPDAKGNNRIDSLINIVETGRVGLMFMLPGIDETVRINGEAFISTSSELVSIFTTERKEPKSVIVINIEEVFMHCAKAIMRSKLWSKDVQVARSDFPLMGRILKDQLGGNQPMETHEEMIKRYEKDL